MVSDKETSIIPVFDIHAAAYLELNNTPPTLTLQGTRVIFEFPCTRKVYGLLKDYQENPSIPVLDFVNALRKLRAKMLAMKG